MKKSFPMTTGSGVFVVWLLLTASASFAQLSCPPMPDKVTQVNRDVRSAVEVGIGSLGKLKAGQLGAKTDVVAKNLFDTYPNTDRLLIAQMMSATYCEMIRDSKTIKDSEKIRLWSEFSDRVFKFENPGYHPSPAIGQPPKSAHKTTPDKGTKQAPPSDSDSGQSGDLKSAIENPGQTPSVVSVGQQGGITAGVINIGTPPPPPLRINWTSSETKGPNSNGEYERVVTVRVNTDLTPVSLAVIADAPVSTFDFASKNGMGATTLRQFTQDTAAVLYYAQPKLTPFDELYITIRAKKPFSVIDVRPAKIKGLND